MRVIAHIADQFVYLQHQGAIYVAGMTGVPGNRVADPEAEVVALRKHAKFLTSVGRVQCGDELDLAADGIEAALKNVHGLAVAAA